MKRAITCKARHAIPDTQEVLTKHQKVSLMTTATSLGATCYHQSLSSACCAPPVLFSPFPSPHLFPTHQSLALGKSSTSQMCFMAAHSGLLSASRGLCQSSCVPSVSLDSGQCRRNIKGCPQNPVAVDFQMSEGGLDLVPQFRCPPDLFK